MSIRFNHNPRTDEYDISKATLAELEGMSAIHAADIMQDVLCDALRAYNRARVRCGWEVTTAFAIGEGSELDGMPE